jgi:hypothetical protein
MSDAEQPHYSRHHNVQLPSLPPESNRAQQQRLTSKQNLKRHEGRGQQSKSSRRGGSLSTNRSRAAAEGVGQRGADGLGFWSRALFTHHQNKQVMSVWSLNIPGYPNDSLSLCSVCFAG